MISSGVVDAVDVTVSSLLAGALGLGVEA